MKSNKTYLGNLAVLSLIAWDLIISFALGLTASNNSVLIWLVVSFCFSAFVIGVSKFIPSLSNLKNFMQKLVKLFSIIFILIVGVLLFLDIFNPQISNHLRFNIVPYFAGYFSLFFMSLVFGAIIFAYLTLKGELVAKISTKYDVAQKSYAVYSLVIGSIFYLIFGIFVPSVNLADPMIFFVLGVFYSLFEPAIKKDALVQQYIAKTLFKNKFVKRFSIMHKKILFAGSVVFIVIFLLTWLYFKFAELSVIGIFMCGLMAFSRINIIVEGY